MTELFFVDTNVLVYRRDASERTKCPRARAWVDRLWLSRAGRLSTQVLQEYYQTVTRKLRPGIPRREARDEIRDLVVWRPVRISSELMERAFQCEDRFGFSFWDSLIVAAAQAASCTYLLTEDLQDGQQLDDVTIVNPFQHDPDELLPDSQR